MFVLIILGLVTAIAVTVAIFSEKLRRSEWELTKELLYYFIKKNQRKIYG